MVPAPASSLPAAASTNTPQLSFNTEGLSLGLSEHIGSPSPPPGPPPLSIVNEPPGQALSRAPPSASASSGSPADKGLLPFFRRTAEREAEVGSVVSFISGASPLLMKAKWQLEGREVERVLFLAGLAAVELEIVVSAGA